MNRLKSESSPYLLQHKNNPVHWYPWGDDAFKAARESGKPIFLSVGYSTCHWCHVMAHESFEDREVGDVLNKDFISIKVDREERPDVDHVYMQALQVISGGGGWPMSVWLTPEGKPFFAGTYFPKFRFLQVLRRITEIWGRERDKLMADSERLTEAVIQSAGTRIAMDADDEGSIDETEYEEFLKTYTNHFQHHFDEANGGFNKAPKFPQTMNLMVMMRRDRATGLNQAETMVTTTLLKMLRGGLYDQLCGGFHRYSVDEKWIVPHFEKMLYDQAMISVAMTDAFQQYGEPEFERGVRGTLEYVLREMKHEGGGFYTGQDADSFNPESHHAEEGYCYTFTYPELTRILSADELVKLQSVFGVAVTGQFEGRNVLHLQDGFGGEVFADPLVVSAFAKLRKVREGRPVPHLDDKVIASWNGWMVWALVRAAVVFKEPKYLRAAQDALAFVTKEMWSGGELKHFWRDGRAVGTATAEDYTSIIHACLEMYQGDFDPKWAAWTLELQAALDGKYWDIDEGAYYANDGQDPHLPMRPKDDYDGVSPGSNSMAAYNLSRLFALTGDAKFNHQAERIFISLFKKLKQYPSGLPFLALALDHHLSGAKVVVMAGGGWVREVEEATRAKFNPHLMWAKAGAAWPAASDKSDKTDSIFVCEAGRCFKPALTAEEAKSQLA